MITTWIRRGQKSGIDGLDDQTEWGAKGRSEVAELLQALPNGLDLLRRERFALARTSGDEIPQYIDHELVHAAESALRDDALEDFIIDNPDSPLIEDAKNSILEARTKLARKAYSNGMTYLKMYSYKAARIYFQMVIDDYTDTGYASKALFKMAESFFKEKKYSEAEEKFGNFLALYPDNEWVPKAREYLDEISYWMSIRNASGESE